LSERLAIARAAFEHSEEITVHLKDKASGQAGFAPFVERVIASRLEHFHDGRNRRGILIRPIV
jgi:hypothetical protein